MTDICPLYLHGLVGGGSAASSASWVRPASWPDLPTDAANTVGIIAQVGDHGSNFAALSATVTGGYTVDWGDGTSDNVSSGVQANHLYNYADTDLGSADADGWKYAVITITPQVGGNSITVLDLGKKHTQSGLANTTNPWLDIRLNLPSCTSLTLRSSSAQARLAQRVKIEAIGAVTSIASLFQDMASLESIPSWPSGSLASCTTVASCFSGCYSLASAPAWPSGSLASCTTVASCFQNCYSLTSAPAWPSGSLGSLTTTTDVVTGASALSRWDGCIIPISFSVVNCRLGPAELDEIYTDLPTVTSKTITVTGNWGTTSDNPSIATAKGWTVVS